MKKYFQLTIAIYFFLFTSCIHTKGKEHEEVKIESIEIDKNQIINKSENSKYKLEIIALRDNQYPLADFFSALKRGQLIEGFKKINLRYQPANYSNKALTMLIEEGFQPVYVRIQNNSDKPMRFDEKSFSIISNDKVIKGFYAEALPQEIGRLNSKALAANIYNTGVVVVSFVGLLGFIYVYSNGLTDMKIPPLFPNGEPNTANPNSVKTPDSDYQVYNDINKSINIDYKNYLLTQTTLQPGQSASGLVFFYDESLIQNEIKQFNFSLNE